MTDAWKLEFDGWDPDAIRVGCGEELRELRPGDTVRFRAVCRAHRGEASGAVRDGSLVAVRNWTDLSTTPQASVDAPDGGSRAT
jgi:hypothetical protein